MICPCDQVKVLHCTCKDSWRFHNQSDEFIKGTAGGRSEYDPPLTKQDFEEAAKEMDSVEVPKGTTVWFTMDDFVRKWEDEGAFEEVWKWWYDRNLITKEEYELNSLEGLPLTQEYLDLNKSFPPEAFVGEDKVNNPSHYNEGAIECIEYLKDNLPHEAFVGYLEGNVKKYMHRWRYKNGVEDIRKAGWYLSYLVDTVDLNDN